MYYAEQILIFLAVFVTTGLLMKWRKKKEISAYSHPPSLLSLPFIGSVGLLLPRNSNNVPVFMMKKAKELGPIFTLRIGNRLAVTLNNKDTIEKAYVKNSSAFSDRPEIFMEDLVNPENKGIISKKKAIEWKKPQKFSLSVLKEFGFGTKSIMEMRIQKEIEAMADYIKNKKAEVFDPKDMCTLATSNIILNMLFGRRSDYELGLSQLSTEIDRMDATLSLIYDILPLIRILPSFRKQLNDYAEISQKAFEYIEAEITQSLNNPDEPCFVQSYIQKAGPDYDRDQLNYLLRDLISAGSGTSSTTLHWALAALANNPTVQKRLHEEIDAAVPGDRFPTLQDVAKLPYVEATILELTRWRTLIPLSIPRVTSQSSVLNGLFIPAGTMVFANLYGVHNDTNVWKDPEVFRPERFLDSENRVVGKDHVIPFSIGRRSCLGETLARAELFLIFTSLVKRFLVLPPEGRDKVNEDPKLPVSVLLFPKAFEIRLVERK